LCFTRKVSFRIRTKHSVTLGLIANSIINILSHAYLLDHPKFDDRKMRNRKIRGHKRKWREIERWVQRNKKLNSELLNQYHNEYTKIIIHPWCDISITKSKFPELRGKTKKKVLNGLIQIYFEWKKQLEELNEEFYLKIWLFEPVFSRSQVVCAIKERIEFYNNNFYPADEKFKSYGVDYENNPSLMNFHWEIKMHEDYFDKSDLGNPDEYDSIDEYEENKKWYNNLFKQPYRTIKFKEPIGDLSECYGFRQGNIWIGEHKN